MLELSKWDFPNAFVICTGTRSSSDNFYRVLDSHEDVVCGWEILTHHDVSYLHSFFLDNSHFSAVGFILMPGQLSDLTVLDNMKVIHLLRIDWVQRALSWVVATRTKQFHVLPKGKENLETRFSKVGDISVKPFSVDIHKVATIAKGYRDSARRFASYLEGRGHLTVLYSNLCDNREGEYKRIYHYLGVPYKFLPDYYVTSDVLGKYRSLVLNYDDVMDLKVTL